MPTVDIESLDTQNNTLKIYLKFQMISQSSFSIIQLLTNLLINK